MDLRVTRRALQDLGIDPDVHAGSPAELLTDMHQVIGAFVALRHQSASGQEITRLPVTRAVVWNLHAARWRGLTWHDEVADIVWLLGVGHHESGSIDDAYAVLKHRDENDQLFPTETDYLDLEPDAEHFVVELGRCAVGLADEAIEDPSRIVGATIAETLRVRLRCDDERLHIGLAMPPLREGVLPTDWLQVAVAAFIPDAPVGTVDWSSGRFPGAPVAGEGGYEMVIAIRLVDLLGE